MWQEGLVTGVGGKRPYHIVNESAKNDGYWHLAHFLLSFTSGPQPWNDASHILGVSSP